MVIVEKKNRHDNWHNRRHRDACQVKCKSELILPTRSFSTKPVSQCHNSDARKGKITQCSKQCGKTSPAINGGNKNTLYAGFLKEAGSAVLLPSCERGPENKCFDMIERFFKPQLFKQ